MARNILIPWEAMVARAVPETPISRYFTRTISPARLRQPEIATKSRGLLESPYPRKIALMALYPQIKRTPQAQTETYSFACEKDAAGVFKAVKTGETKAKSRKVKRMPAMPKIVRLVAMVSFMSSGRFIPAYFPTKTVPPRVRPEIILVIIWVTWVPVETAATLSGGQYQPITIKSTAPYSA